MTKDTLAAQLHGQQYPIRIPQSLAAEAKAAGLVIVFGASDDLMEFRGAIHEELDAYEGRETLLTTEGLFEELTCECRYYRAAKARAEQDGASLRAVWDAEGYSWIYDTTIPHAPFDILEGDDTYCRGIVFALADVGKPAGD